MSKIIITIFFFANFVLSMFGQTKTNYRILTYGLPNLTRNSAMEIIGSKWGIDFYPIAGCMIEEELKDSAEKENQSTYGLLAAKFGKDCERRLYSEKEKEYNHRMEISDFVDSLKFIKEKIIAKFIPGEGYKMHRGNNKNIYIVNVEGWGDHPIKEVYYILQVNYKKKTVKIINYKTKKA